MVLWLFSSALALGENAAPKKAMPNTAVAALNNFIFFFSLW
jgi:hypothetical protein